MSLGLVSYESSSDESDSGEENEYLKLNESSEENLQVKGPTVGAGLSQHAQPSSSGRDAKPLGGLFSSLPSPKAIKKQGNSQEDVVTSSRDSKPFINPQTKKASAVKIVAPSLPEPDSDSDEEPQTKKVKTGKKISSLFAMLPEPKHATLKQTNRLLIPHTLTKKKPDLPSNVKKYQPAKTASNLSVIRSSETDGGDGFDDEDNSNFFSLSNDKDDKSSVSSNREKEQVITFDKSMDTQPVVQVSHDNKHERQVPVSHEQVTPTVTHTGPKNVPLPEEPSRTVPSKLVSPSINQSEATVQAPPLTSQRESKLLKSVQPDMNEQPLNFSGQRTPYVQPDKNEQPLSFNNKRTPYGYQSQPSASYGYTPQSEQYGVSNQEDYGTYQGGYPGYQQQEYPMYHEQYAGESSYSGGHSSAISSSMMQDKDFQRMIGKGKFDPHAANIIDVNADDHISTVRAEDWMLKSMTEEKQAREKLSKEELPTSQQKRKHQITYLARQAKERELELKNSWAQNRMTRKQTQAKYGF